MAKPLNPLRRWTVEDIEYVWLVCVRAHCENSHTPVTEIARRLNRSVQSVQGKLQFLMRERWHLKNWPTTYNYLAVQSRVRLRAHQDNDELILGKLLTTE